MAKKTGDKSDLLTKEEMSKLLISVSGDIYFTTFYETLKQTGRRTGEIYGTIRGKELTGGIRVKDIDFKNKQMTTNILKTKKRRLQIECPSCKNKGTYKNKFCGVCGNTLPEIDKEELYYSATETKIIPLKESFLILLENYIKKQKLGMNDYLFREYSLSYLKKAVKNHCKRAGITKNFSLHGFRAYFITACKRAGLSNEDIAKWTGHISPVSVNVYNRMVPREIEHKILEVDL
jgi:integrase